jgi:hypothetical protein
VDCYAVVDLDVLVQAVDLMGGVWFDVPQAMDYDDPSQDLAIHLSPGRQLLNGEQAMGVCRYRSAYVTGDLGRIEMQHRFLEACAEQFISAGNIPNLGKVAELLARRTDTNLSTGNIAWLLHQALLCDKENICFYTAPVVTETVAGYSYVLLNLWPWLDLVNAHLNPYDLPIGYTDVDVVYRNEYGVACTATLQDESYYRREGPAPAVEPAPGTPVVTPEPTPSPEPTPEEKAAAETAAPVLKMAESVPAGKSYEEMTVEELQRVIYDKMAANGPVTDQMQRTIEENTHHGSLVNWARSFR